jgi:hypothetical protein
MIINKTGGFQLPSGGQMQKKYFCVQKNEAITSELSGFYCATIFGISQNVPPSAPREKRLSVGAALDFLKKRFPAKAKG